MAEEYISLKRDVVQLAQTLSAEAFKVYLVLIERQLAQKFLKVGLSLSELARRCDLGTGATKRSLGALRDAQLLTIEKKGVNFKLVINDYFTEENIPIPFTFVNTDENKLRTIENELSRLQLEQVRDTLGRESGIAGELTEEKRDIVLTIERDLGRALTVIEAYRLGEAMSAFGPTRIKSTRQRKAATAKTPIKALTAILWNQAVGKPAKEREMLTPPEVRDL